MGYSMQQGNTKFHIKKKNFASAMEAIHKAEVDGRSWEDKNLVDALADLGWDPLVDKKTGDLTDVAYQYMKLTSDIEELFEAVAPFVEPGSYIEAVGEDMTYWRWYFDGKTCVEQFPKHIEWE